MKASYTDYVVDLINQYKSSGRKRPIVFWSKIDEVNWEAVDKTVKVMGNEKTEIVFSLLDRMNIPMVEKVGTFASERGIPCRELWAILKEFQESVAINRGLI